MQIETSGYQGGVHQLMGFTLGVGAGDPNILLGFSQKLVSVSLFSEAIHFFQKRIHESAGGAIHTRPLRSL